MVVGGVAIRLALRVLDRWYRRGHAPARIEPFGEIEQPDAEFECALCGATYQGAGCDECAIDLREVILANRARRKRKRGAA